MTRHIFSSLFLITLSLLVKAQDAVPCPTMDTVFVVPVDSTLTAAQLHSNARRWFALAFKDAQEVIQLDDNATHTIIGKGTSAFAGGGHIKYTIEINGKDGRFRASITDVRHVNPGKTYNAVLKTYVDNMEYGTIYRCDQCIALYQWRKAAHPQQTAKLAKDAKHCQSTLVPQVSATVTGLAASITAAMLEKTASTQDGDDW